MGFNFQVFMLNLLVEMEGGAFFIYGEEREFQADLFGIF